MAYDNPAAVLAFARGDGTRHALDLLMGMSLADTLLYDIEVQSIVADASETRAPREVIAERLSALLEKVGAPTYTPEQRTSTTLINRGLRSRQDFMDLDGVPCSIQMSRPDTEPAIWFGSHTQVEGIIQGGGTVPINMLDAAIALDHRIRQITITGRMHLTQTMVQQLLPLLQHFAEHGKLP